MQNTANDEDILLVEQSLMNVEPTCFKSANDLIDVRLTPTSGPELILSDRSRIVFTSFAQYYKFISDRHEEKIYDTESKQFNIAKMNELYFVSDDDVVDIIYRQQELYHVALYVDPSISSATIYRFYTRELM